MGGGTSKLQPQIRTYVAGELAEVYLSLLELDRYASGVACYLPSFLWFVYITHLLRVSGAVQLAPSLIM